MTLEELREELKARYDELWEGPWAPNNLQGLNMRQSWVKSHDILDPMLTQGDPGVTMRKIDLYRFMRAGDIYYHAKDHGIASALYLKLTLT